MNTQINISRKVIGQVEDKGEFGFMEGDGFNIYLGVGVSNDLFNEENKKYIAFKITSIASDNIQVEVLYNTIPSTEPFALKLNESKDLDFNEYGVYTLTVKDIQ